MMELLDLILHVDEKLGEFLVNYGPWVYGILFLIIFVETGVVIMPFLPGDSLLFAAGMLASQYPESLNVWLVILLLIIAAFFGDTMNYTIGKYLGNKALNVRIFGRQFVKKEHIDKTNGFFEKYGPRTIIIARFVPIVRTLAPFVAGVGRMRYGVFLSFNIIGALIWVIGLTLAGYYLGRIPLIKDNFSVVVMIIIFLSIMPMVFEFFKAKRESRRAKKVVVPPTNVNED